MERATDRKELIEATGAIISTPNEVTLAGGIKMPLEQFEREVKDLISLGATDKTAAAKAITNYASSRRTDIITP